MRFIETPVFTRDVVALLSDNEYRSLQPHDRCQRGDAAKLGAGSPPSGRAGSGPIEGRCVASAYRCPGVGFLTDGRGPEVQLAVSASDVVSATTWRALARSMTLASMLGVAEHSIQHPVLMQRVNLEFDTALPEFRFNTGTDNTVLVTSHTPEQLHQDLERQAMLERLGWMFVRVRGIMFFRDPDRAMAPMLARLHQLGIGPLGGHHSTEPDLLSPLVDRIRRAAEVIREGWRAGQLTADESSMERV